MSPSSQSPSTLVNAWIGSLPEAPEALAERARTALDDLRRRTIPSVGDTATSVIFARVLAASRNRHPILQHIALAPHEHAADFSATALTHSLLRDGIEQLLIDLLTALARLTAGALTGALHATLRAAGGTEAYRVHVESTGGHDDESTQ